MFVALAMVGGWFVAAVLMTVHTLGWVLGWWPMDALTYWLALGALLVMCAGSAAGYFYDPE